MSQGQLPEKFRGMKIPWGPIGEPVYKRTYSLTRPDGRKEQWPDTVVRAVDGNLALVDPQFIEPDEREKLIGLMLPFGILPAGRHLNASGVKGRQFLFNCHAAGWDYEEPWAHFAFTFDELMMGGGVGSNYSNRYLDQMPPVRRSIDLHVVCRPDHPNRQEFEEHLSSHISRSARVGGAYGRLLDLGDEVSFTVPDSREGWVQAVELLCRIAWAPLGVYGMRKEVPVTIDVSPVRARGEPLKTSGGIACGPGPLVELLVDFARHLNGCVGRRLSSTDAMVLDHHIASGVIAGGKRRSSRISVKHWADPDILEFINCKRVSGAHWTTNISVEIDDDFFAYYHGVGRAADLALVDPITALSKVCDGCGLHIRVDAPYCPECLKRRAREVMRAVVLGKRNNGEPGFWNRSLSMKGERDPEAMYCPNPCGEIGLQMWENCNLGHVNLEYFVKRPRVELLEAFRLVARWLVRATYGDIPQPRQRAVVDRNRRIGVGFLGYHAWLALRGTRYSDSYKTDWVIETLSMAHTAVIEEATRYAKAQGIPVPAKFTTLAPTGTGALMPGTTASAQALLMPRGKRLTRYSSMDPELAVKKLEGYEVFPDKDAKNTEVVVYWYEDPLVAKVRAAGFDPEEILEGQYEISFHDSLEVQKMLQTVWADNAIAFTINLPADLKISEEEMEAELIAALPYLKGTTVFPDKSRYDAPFQPVSKEQFDAYTGRKEVFQVEEECRGGCPIK